MADQQQQEQNEKYERPVEPPPVAYTVPSNKESFDNNQSLSSSNPTAYSQHQAQQDNPYHFRQDQYLSLIHI